MLSSPLSVSTAAAIPLEPTGLVSLYIKRANRWAYLGHSDGDDELSASLNQHNAWTRALQATDDPICVDEILIFPPGLSPGSIAEAMQATANQGGF
jgi:hypothetical protein